MNYSNSVFVILAGFLGQFICEGVEIATELFLPYLQKCFSWTNAQVALVGSGMNGLPFLLGPLSSYSAQKVGDRPLVMFCGVFGAAMFLIGSLSTSLWQVVLSVSLVGASYGLASVPIITAISFHFTTHRHVLTTAVTTGGALGGVILPFVMESVLSTSPWQHGFVAAACITLQLTVCGAMFVKPKTIENTLSQSIDENVNEILVYGDEQDATLHGKQDDGEEKLKQQNDRFYPPCALWCLLIQSFVWNMGGFMYYTIIPLRLDGEEYTGYHIALIFSMISVFVIVGRVAASLLVLWQRCDVVLIFNVSMLCMGMCLFWMSWPQKLAIYLTGFSVYGLFYGLVTAVIPSVIITLVGMDDVYRVQGLELFTAGIAGVVGPFTAGWAADLLGSFFPVCLFSSLAVMVAVPLVLPFHWPLSRFWNTGA